MQAIANDPASRKRTPPTGQPTILLVESDATVCNLVACLLQRDGYAVLKARQGAEALAFSEEFDGSLHLLFTDLSLGSLMGGRQLAGAVRRARPGLPVLYMSGMVEDEGVSEEILRGEARFLPKPFSTFALVEAVRLSLGRPLSAR
ncbi:MAG TPA: response regulator [Fibrobacteria bacterium]|nr:response regulator [Fibrobacteria bacterium]